MGGDSKKLGQTKSSYLDGGWGWIVVLASFLSQTLIGSVYFGYGVLLPAWMSEFQSSSAITSFVGSTTAGAISASGPIASFFICKWGCRITHMAGGATMALALVCCSFATSMAQIFFLYSVMAGLGGGLCYIPSVITISEFFKAKRSIAIGVISSGIGFGSFIFPVIFESIIGKYGWRGGLLIVGAINCNMIAFGLVMCPVEKAPYIDFSACHPRRCFVKTNDPRKPLPTDEIVKVDHNFNVISNDLKADQVVVERRRRTSFHLMRAWLRNPLARRKSSLAQQKSTITESAIDDDVFVVTVPNAIPEEALDIERSGLLPTEPEKASSKNAYRKQIMSLLKRPEFYTLLFHNATMFFGMMIVFGLTPLRAVTDYSMTAKQGAALVSIMGLANLLGRLAWGFVAAFKTVDTPSLFISLRLVAAFLTLLSPLATTFAWNAVFCAFVGLAFGNWSIYPVVVAEQFGDHLLTVSYGFLETSNGVGCVIGPLVGGYLYDVFKSYKNSFLISGVTLIGGVAPLILMHIVKKCRNSKSWSPTRPAGSTA